MPVRLRDVADLAGVSMTTASIVLRRQPGARVSSGTRERVRQAADRLGYRPRDVTPSPRLIGVLFRGDLGDVGLDFMAALVEAARLRDCVVLVLPAGEHEAGKTHVPNVGDLPLHGIISVGTGGSHVAAPAHLADRTVLVDFWPGPGAESAEGSAALVLPDDLRCAMDLAHRLARLGHRRVAIVAPDQGTRGVAGRWRRGLLRVLESGADVEVVDDARALAADDVRHVAEQCAYGVTAIVCLGGRCAEAVLADQSGTGLVIPGALEIVVRCAPGDEIAPTPGAVRIAVPAADLARAAVGRLVDPVGASDSRSRRLTHVPFALDLSRLEPDVLSPVG